MDYIPVWRGDGIPAPETRQQRRYAARRRGEVTGRTVAVVVAEREEIDAGWKRAVASWQS